MSWAYWEGKIYSDIDVGEMEDDGAGTEVEVTRSVGWGACVAASCFQLLGICTGVLAMKGSGKVGVGGPAAIEVSAA